MSSSYSYTFHYKSGQRATQTILPADIRPKDLLNFAHDLARNKKKTIFIRSHTLRWYDDRVSECGWVEPNGKYMVMPVQYTTYVEGKL